MTDQFFDKESLVKNFLSADKESLMKMSFDNGYCFLEEEVLYIQSHLRYQKKALPTYNQLDFFNEISKIRQREKINFAISSVATNSPEQSIRTPICPRGAKSLVFIFSRLYHTEKEMSIVKR